MIFAPEKGGWGSGWTYHVEHRTAHAAVASNVGSACEAVVSKRVVVQLQAWPSVGGVGFLEDGVAEAAGEAEGRGGYDALGGSQVERGVYEGAICNTVASLAAEAGVWVEDHGVRDVGAGVRIHHLIPIRLGPRVVALVLEKSLVCLHKVTVPGQEGSLEERGEEVSSYLWCRGWLEGI